MSRLHQDPKVVECLVIDAEFIGQSALELFNELLDNAETASIPALLLLDPDQKKFAAHAKKSENRRVVCMPITNRQFRDMLVEMMGVKAEEDK